MSYMTWTGNTEPEDRSGNAFIIVEGESLLLRLPNFTTAMQLDRLMELAFQQGKQFAARAMRSHIEAGMDAAVSAHEMYVTPKAKLICRKCGVDRYQQPCPGPHGDCPMVATALAAKDAT